MPACFATMLHCPRSHTDWKTRSRNCVHPCGANCATVHSYATAYSLQLRNAPTRPRWRPARVCNISACVATMLHCPRSHTDWMTRSRNYVRPYGANCTIVHNYATAHSLQLRDAPTRPRWRPTRVCSIPACAWWSMWLQLHMHVAKLQMYACAPRVYQMQYRPHSAASITFAFL